MHTRNDHRYPSEASGEEKRRREVGEDGRVEEERGRRGEVEEEKGGEVEEEKGERRGRRGER